MKAQNNKLLLVLVTVEQGSTRLCLHGVHIHQLCTSLSHPVNHLLLLVSLGGVFCKSYVLHNANRPA